VFVFAVAIGVLATVYLWDSHDEVVNTLDLLFGSAACLSLWARRQRPVAVLVAAAAGIFSPLALGAALVAVFNAATRGRGRVLVAVALLALTGSVLFPFLYPKAGPVLGQRFPGFMLTTIAFGWGMLVRARREIIVALRNRAERLEAEQERNAELARDAERRRIAREMHDGLAHRLSLLSVHAGALAFNPDAPSAQVAEAASVIRASAVAALNELRQVITFLREESPDPTPSQSTLAQLRALFDESRSAGMDLRTQIDVSESESLPDALGRTAFRVVQEGLTNALKHSVGAAVDVSVCGNGRVGLEVEVISHSRNGIPISGMLASTGTGVGLFGLEGRLALVGGELEHHTTSDGDFVLHASLPRRA
jgi:signal transduction histidine kinase